LTNENLPTPAALTYSGDLVGTEDVRAAWDVLDTERQRGVIDTLMDVVLFPVGRGARHFDPSTIKIIPKEPR
jgi:hypothetical protein